MVIIFLSTQSKKREVIAFLDELKSILENADFDIDTDLTLISKKKQGEDQKYSTPYTLLDLDYDTEDVVERLKELTGDQQRHVLCVSFHYAKEKITFPYA